MERTKKSQNLLDYGSANYNDGWAAYFYKKFYWNPDTAIHLHTVCNYFPITRAELKQVQ